MIRFGNESCRSSRFVIKLLFWFMIHRLLLWRTLCAATLFDVCYLRSDSEVAPYEMVHVVHRYTFLRSGPQCGPSLTFWRTMCAATHFFVADHSVVHPSHLAHAVCRYIRYLWICRFLYRWTLEVHPYNQSTNITNILFCYFHLTVIQ